MDRKEAVIVSLPNVLSKKRLSVTKEAIGKHDDVDEFAYLQGVQLPRAIDHGDISLLIGDDVPEAIKPVAIRESRNVGPYAVKALLGCTLNRPLNRCSKDKHSFFTRATASADDPLSNQLKRYFNQEFDESIADHTKAMSVEDKHALKIFEESAQLVKSHY